MAKKKEVKKVVKKRVPKKQKPIAKGLTKNYRGNGPVDAAHPPSSDPNKPAPKNIEIERPAYEWLRFRIIFDTPLLQNGWTETAKQAMRDTHAKVKKPRRVRTPETEWLESAHICKGQYEKAWIRKNLYGFPAVGLKQSMAATAFKMDMHHNKIDLITFMFVHGPYDGLFPIYSKFGPLNKRKAAAVGDRGHTPCIPTMREDVVKLPKAGADFTYRASFFPACAEVDIRYWPNILSMDSVANLLEHTGSVMGIGSWTNPKKGVYGAFHVDLNNIVQLPADHVPLIAK